MPAYSAYEDLTVTAGPKIISPCFQSLPAILGLISPLLVLESITKEDILMSSAAQIAANRENSQHCTGPKTEAGKQISKMNALKAGLTSSQVVLPHEDRAAFEDLKAGLVAEHQPVGEMEHLFVSQLAETWWRCLRARRVETEYLSQLVSADPAKGDAAIAKAVTAEKNNTFSKMQRYVNAAERAFKSALKQLQDTQRARLKEEEQKRVNDILHARAAARIGFVSQQPEKTLPSPPPPVSNYTGPSQYDGFWLKNPPVDPAEAILKSLRSMRKTA